MSLSSVSHREFADNAFDRPPQLFSPCFTTTNRLTRLSISLSGVSRAFSNFFSLALRIDPSSILTVPLPSCYAISLYTTIGTREMIENHLSTAPPWDPSQPGSPIRHPLAEVAPWSYRNSRAIFSPALAVLTGSAPDRESSSGEEDRASSDKERRKEEEKQAAKERERAEEEAQRLIDNRRAIWW